MPTTMTIEQIFGEMKSKPVTHWRTIDQMIGICFPTYPAREAWAHGLAVSFNETIWKGYDPGQMERIYLLIEKMIQWDKDHNEINFIDLDIMEELKFLFKFMKIELRNGEKEIIVFANGENMMDFIETVEKSGFKNYKAHIKNSTLEFEFMTTAQRAYATTNFEVTFTTTEKV